MANLRCGDYGYDCDYIIEGAIQEVVFEYWKHMNNKHEEYKTQREISIAANVTEVTVRNRVKGFKLDQKMKF